MKTYSTVITEENNKVLLAHLLREDGQEDICFATYLPSTGRNRCSAIIQSIILPEEDEREVHGNVAFLHNYFERVLRIASDRKEGIVILHSHPGGEGWQGMSKDDVIAETRIAPAVLGMTRLPLVGLTVAGNGDWSARFWEKDGKKKRHYNRCWCESVRILGEKLTVSFNHSLVKHRINSEKQLRTISAWGKKTQEDISRIRIGIVGLGSVGSTVAEILARTGFTDFALIDFDSVEEKNLDRLPNVYKGDIGKAKVKVISDAIERSASAPLVITRPNEHSICEENGFRDALDCDVIFCCVDRPWPRQVLNYIAYCHLIPVIDGGIYVRTNKKNTSLVGADWKVQTVGYNRACLECLGQFSTGDAKLEIDGLLDSPRYINQLAETDRKRIDAHENVFAFSSYVASMEVIQVLNLLVAPQGFGNIGQHSYHMIPGEMITKTDNKCHENCYFQQITGKGDSSGLVMYGEHKVAESARQKRQIKSAHKKFFFKLITI